MKITQISLIMLMLSMTTQILYGMEQQVETQEIIESRADFICYAQKNLPYWSFVYKNLLRHYVCAARQSKKIDNIICYITHLQRALTVDIIAAQNNEHIVNTLIAIAQELEPIFAAIKNQKLYIQDEQAFRAQLAQVTNDFLRGVTQVSAICDELEYVYVPVLNKKIDLVSIRLQSIKMLERLAQQLQDEPVAQVCTLLLSSDTLAVQFLGLLAQERINKVLALIDQMPHQEQVLCKPRVEAISAQLAPILQAIPAPSSENIELKLSQMLEVN